VRLQHLLLSAIVLAQSVSGGQPAVQSDVQPEVELFADDFTRFPPGMLSAPIGLLNGAIQEYHYIEHRGVPTHPWRNPIVHLDTWAAGDDADGPYLEQHTVNLEPQRVTPLFVTGDPEWRDYRVEASVRPLSLQQEAGLVFRYRTSRHYYRLALEDGARLRLVVRLPIDQGFRVAAWRELAIGCAGLSTASCSLTCVIPSCQRGLPASRRICRRGSSRSA
jgi:hypothetical protein